MELTKELTILLVNMIICAVGEEVKIGIIFDERIVKSHKLRDYLGRDIKPVFVSSAYIQESNVPDKLKNVMCIVCISRKKDINDQASKLGEMLQIPVITSAPNTAPNGKFTVSMYPDYELANRVMVDSLKFWDNNPVALLYDIKRSKQAANLQSLARESNIRMFLMPEINMEDEKSLSYAAGELKRSHLTSVVLLCDPRNISTVMDHTIEFNLYGTKDEKVQDEDEEEKPKEWKWFALDMDFEPKQNCIPSLHGFVGFVTKIYDERENEWINKFKDEILETEEKIHTLALSNNFYANLHDILVIVRNISVEHFRERLTVQTLRQVTIPACSGDMEWSLRPMNCPLSGEVEFDGNGTRKMTVMKIVDIQEGDNPLNRVGEWTPALKTHKSRAAYMIWVQSDKRQKCNNSETTNKKMYRILVKTGDEPFVIINNNKSLPVEERFTGYCIDIVRELAKPEYMNFNYTIDIKNGTGSFNESTGRWSDIIGELIDQKAEMGTGSLTITAQREKAVDFSKPFMDFKMAMILRKPDEEKLNMFRFLDPFSPIVWLCTVMTVFAMTIFMYIVDYLSPYGNRKTAEPDEPGNEFSLYNSLWFATASMLQQGPDNTPKSPSGRLLAASFWFFVLLMISTYTANLAAFFTNKKPNSAISNLEELSKQSKVKYGVLKGGQIHNFLIHSNDTVHKKMVTDMTRFDSFAKGARVGVERARKGGFAYITEEPILEYWNSKSPCNTMLVKQLLEAKSYGFALTKNSELTNNLSVNILKLREKKFMDERYTYWWKARSECPTTVKPIGLDSMKIQFSSMAGVFIILVSGVIISLILVVVEVKCKWIIDLILEAGCEQCTDYYCEDEDEESYEYMEPAVEATAPCSLKRVPDVYSNAQESKV